MVGQHASPLRSAPGLARRAGRLNIAGPRVSGPTIALLLLFAAGPLEAQDEGEPTGEPAAAPEGYGDAATAGSATPAVVPDAYRGPGEATAEPTTPALEPVATVAPAPEEPEEESDIEVCWDPRDYEPGSGGRSHDTIPRQPCQRSTVEMVELYAYAGVYGLGAGAFVGEGLGVNDGGARFATATLLGTGTVLGVLMLDQNTLMLPGMPTTISTGLMLGAIEAFIVGGATRTGDPFQDAGAGIFLGVSSLSVGLSLLAAYTLEPTTADNSLIRSGALWGMFYALTLTLITDEDDNLDRWRAIFTGFNAGIVVAGIASAVLPIHRTRVLQVDLGGLLGMIAGGVVLGAAGADNPDDTAVGWSLGLGSLAGMSLAYFISEPIAPEPLPEADSVLSRVRMHAAPTPGGALVGATTTF